jgi:type I restriction enzyme S subunit
MFEHYSLPAFDADQSPALDLGATIKSNKTPVPTSAVLLSKLNPETSRVWIPDPPRDLRQISSTEFLIFKPRGDAGVPFLFGLMRSLPFKTMLEGMVTGTSTSHQRISPPALLLQNVVVADDPSIVAYGDLVAPLLRQVLANRRESRTLAATRDLLLPKLMSGEIRVRDAEKIVEAAA